MHRRISVVVVVLLSLMMVPQILLGTSEAFTVPLLNFRIGTYTGDGKPINCWQGERLLRKREFRDIRRIDCRGRYYVYHGTRRGARYEVEVRSRDGRVVDTRRILR